MRFVLTAIVVLLSFSSAFPAETRILENSRNSGAISAGSEGKFLVAVAETKKLVDAGQTKAAQQAFEALKVDFPEIAGPELDIFIKAELYYCKGHFIKAVRNYEKLLTEYPKSRFSEAARPFCAMPGCAAPRSQSLGAASSPSSTGLSPACPRSSRLPRDR